MRLQRLLFTEGFKTVVGCVIAMQPHYTNLQYRSKSHGDCVEGVQEVDIQGAWKEKEWSVCRREQTLGRGFSCFDYLPKKYRGLVHLLRSIRRWERQAEGRYDSLLLFTHEISCLWPIPAEDGCITRGSSLF